MEQPTSADGESAKNVLAEYLQSRQPELSFEQTRILLAFCALILRWNRLTSLVQANSVEQLVKSHVVDCLAAIDEICGPNIADIGSGAGFPGIVFAIAKPQWRFYLVEANARRARFLTQVQIDLSLKNVIVVNERIEDWQSVEQINCFTSRAYSALGSFYQDCQHLLPETRTAAARFVALKGRVEQQELATLNAAGIPPERITVKPLMVPDREHRHVVLFEANNEHQL